MALNRTNYGPPGSNDARVVSVGAGRRRPGPSLTGVQQPESLGEAVALLRRNMRPRGWSQEDLAFAIGTEQPQISRIESNRQRPMYPTLIRIFNALELDPKDRARLLHLAG
jgi:ribosome-binding protein aMBF1 (putative translation factor)